jgi:YidC/Oxa1 family membrane protein insertase
LPEYKNPNAGGGSSTDMRSFLVMMLVFAGVLFGIKWWSAKHNPETAAPNAPAAQTQQAPPAAGTSAAAASGNVPASVVASSTTTAATAQADAEQTTVVENDLYKITFSNRGGEARSWILKKYKDEHGAPLDLVHDAAAAHFGYPLSLYTYDPAVTKALATALYIPSATGTAQISEPLTFHWAANGFDVTKTFTFGSDYVIHADTQVLRNGAPIAALVSWPASFGDMSNLIAYNGAVIDQTSGKSTDHLEVKKVVGGATENGPFDWVGVTDQYFGAIFLPDNPADATVVTLHNELMTENKSTSKPDAKGAFQPVPAGELPKGMAKVPFIGAALGSHAGHVQTRLFVGPKNWSVLGNVKSKNGDTLHSIIDFGFWGYVSQGLFLGLRAVHGWIAPAESAFPAKDWSWGWAIVIFTVLINLILLPLRVQGMKGMLKMQRIQPQIDAIKAKFGNPGPTSPKQAEQNAEIMALQKREGVSMFGGCVPTLIQFPLLFAFFTMMTKVVELRHAHWFWLPDLSSADPYHILPIVMVLTSFLVQFYTPSPGVDPQQQRMMAFMMPAFSGWMTWNYASGLALYWNIGNFIMIIQQQVMNRTELGREMKALQAARVKRNTVPAGSKPATPRTIQGKR